MALNLLSTPEKTIQGILSNVDGARSQLPYAFQREDYEISNVFQSNINTGRIRAIIKAGTGDFTSQFTQGQIVYLNSPNDIDGGYVGNYTVDFADFPADETRVYMLEENVYLTNGNAGYMNNLTYRKNYKVYIEIFKSDASDYLIPITFKYSPDPKGRLFVDLGAILTEYQEANLLSSVLYTVFWKETYEGEVGFWTQTGIIQSIYGEKQLLDIGGANMYEYLLEVGGTDIEPFNYPPDTPTARPSYGGNTWQIITEDVLQGQFVANGNMQPVTFKPDVAKGGTIEGTKGTFKYKIYYNVQGFLVAGTVRMDLVGIYEDGVSAQIWANQAFNVSANGTGYWEGETQVPTTTPTEEWINIAFRPSKSDGDFNITFVVNTASDFMTFETYKPPLPATVFKNPVFWEGFARNFSYIIDSNFVARTGAINAIHIRAVGYNINKVDNGLANIVTAGGSGYTVGLFNVNFNVPSDVVNDSYYVACSVRENNINIALNEPLYYERRCVPANPIYIGWINSKGGFDEWMFSYNQAVDRTVEEGLLAESVINEDIEVVRRTKKRLPNTWKQQIILEADNLKLDQLKALAEIKQSDYVVVNLNKSGSKEIFVVVNNGYSTLYDTKEELYTFTLQIELPDNFDLFKALEY